MSKEIIFERAKIVEVKHNLGKIGPANTVPSVLKVIAIMTAEIANAIGYRWLLFDREQGVKNGYAEVVLDLEMNSLRVKFNAPKMQGLDLYVDRASRFKVYTKGDGKKKGKRLMVSFLLHQFGSPFDLLEYLLKVGGIEGSCSLMPRQEELPLRAVEAASSVVGADAIMNYAGRPGWSARITVSDLTGGFHMIYRATSPHKKLAQKAAEVFASENQARETGAISIRRWAEKIAAGGLRTYKKEATEMIKWCDSMLQSSLVDREVAAGAPAN